MRRRPRACPKPIVCDLPPKSRCLASDAPTSRQPAARGACRRRPRSRAATRAAAIRCRGYREGGIRVDTGVLAELSKRVDQELESRSARIFALAGETFNINSPRQLSEILFDKLQLPALRRTGKTKVASTAVEVLEELALTHELPREILEWRGLQKLKGTYIDALPALVNPRTGRVHTSFNQAVAATGRLSSSDPNLQNIPIRRTWARVRVRRGAGSCADLGHTADESVLAHMSGDGAIKGVRAARTSTIRPR
jgi:DNA polymerase-1